MLEDMVFINVTGKVNHLYLLEAKEALDAASRIIKAFFGDVNDDEAFKGCSSDTLEAADMDRS